MKYNFNLNFPADSPDKFMEERYTEIIKMFLENELHLKAKKNYKLKTAGFVRYPSGKRKDLFSYQIKMDKGKYEYNIVFGYGNEGKWEQYFIRRKVTHQQLEKALMEYGFEESIVSKMDRYCGEEINEFKR